MTYCVGLQLSRGLVMMSDTRTNAGIDNISTFRKMHVWSRPGSSAIFLTTSGNVATTQAVVSILDERTKAHGARSPSILDQESMFQVARMVGDTLREVISTYRPAGMEADGSFNATLIVGGQIGTGEPRLFMVYPEGNFIESSTDTPFFQIGETKYGRPILVRAYDRDMSFEDAIKLLLVSFDSTIKANLSVDLPIDYRIYEAGSLVPGTAGRITRDDHYYQTISDVWGEALRAAFDSLPDFRLPERTLSRN